VNDVYGRDVGDEVLASLAKLISKGLRKTDYFFRFGGEEFVIFLPDTSIAVAKKIAKRIITEVRNHSFDRAGRITVSIGVAEYKKSDNKDLFLKRADEKLYEAKNAGRNRVRW